MHAKASSGQQDNNLKFSACSHASIEKLLNERLLQGWPFIQDSSSFCGNQVVERFANGTGEQCDCGYPVRVHAVPFTRPTQSEHITHMPAVLSGGLPLPLPLPANATRRLHSRIGDVPGQVLRREGLQAREGR